MPRNRNPHFRANPRPNSSPSRRLGSIALLAATLLGACVQRHSKAAVSGDQAISLEIGGDTRTYYLHVPANRPGGALPLVIALHGGGGNGPIQAEHSGFSAVADANGFIVAYPDGSGRLRNRLLTWNAGTCCAYAAEHQTDDTGFIRAVVADIERRYPVDRRRVYATGMSNGGMMSYRLACEAGDVFAAIGVVSGVQTLSPCTAAQPVSVIHFHGTADQHVPMGGGVGSSALDRTPKPPVLESPAFWARRDGCQHQGGSAPQPVTAHVTRTDYGPCAAGTDVQLWLIEGGGHAWPGGARIRWVGDTPTTEISATQRIWQFFAAHPKP